MRLSAASLLALTALLVVAPLGVVAATPAAATSDSHALASVDVADVTPPEPDDPRQVIRIAVTDDGDAVWTVESRFVLENETDYDDFEAYADALTAGERDVGYGPDLFEEPLDLAEASTEREMNLEDGGWDEPRIEADDDADHEIGIVSYSVTWSNFAVVDGNRIILGDAFQLEDGTWFGALDGDQRLVIERPANSTFEDVPRGLEDGMLVWDGPHEFSEDELEVTFRIGGNDDGNDDGDDPSPPPSTNDGFLGGLFASNPATAGAGLLLLLALVGGGGYLLASRERLPDLIGGDDRETSASEPAADDESDEKAAVPSVEFDDSAVGDTADEPEEIDVELLSDEERVLRLLRQNGGRMKQAMIVTETGWSNAKVSQLLSKMDEGGEIEKLRIGRENLITLPEVDPTEIE